MGITRPRSKESLTSPGEQVVKLYKQATPVYALYPGPDVLQDIVSSIVKEPPVPPTISSQPDQGAPVRITCQESTAESLFKTFRIGHQAIELLESNLIDLRSATADNVSPLIVSESKTVGIVQIRGCYTIFSPTDDVSHLAKREVNHHWSTADVADRPDLKEWSQITTSLERATSQETLEVFANLLDAEQSGSDSSLNTVEIILIAGAATEAKQKSIVRWSNENSVTSSTKISNTKSRLEDAGVLSDIQVPTKSPGRPVNQLRFADPKYKELTTSKLHDIVTEIL